MTRCNKSEVNLKSTGMKNVFLSLFHIFQFDRNIDVLNYLEGYIFYKILF